MKYRVEISTWDFPLNAIRFADEKETFYYYYDVQIRFFETQEVICIAHLQ